MKAITMLVLVLLVGCDASPDMQGYGGEPPAPMRGDVAGEGGAPAPDAGTSGAGGAMAGTGGRADGAGGARAEMGGAPGAGGTLAGVGGMTGAGGSGTGGRASAGPDTPYCGDLGYTLGFHGCSIETSPGVFINGKTTDGHACVTCPGVPVGVQCFQIGALCVDSCSLCVYQ